MEKETTPTPQLDQVGELYTVAYLEGRNKAGLELSESDREQLDELNDRFAGDDSHRGKRRHRRLDVTLPAILKRRGRNAPALVLNMSAGGFLFATTQSLKVGDHVQLKLGSPEVEYHFPCEVRRVTGFGGTSHVAVSCSSLPLEIRHGDSQVARLGILTTNATGYAGC